MIKNSEKIDARNAAAKLLNDCKKREKRMISLLVCEHPKTYTMIPKTMKKADREKVKERVLNRIKS